MCKNVIKHLAWDSDFFAKKVGKIDCENSLQLADLLRIAKTEKYDLIYVFGNADFYAENEILETFNGKLVARKVLYCRHCGLSPQSSVCIKAYQSTTLTPELENLTYTSGEFSRFKLDKNFAENDFYRMYKIWIENSLNRQNADYVFVAIENEQIKGMVTLQITNAVGLIGLIAVAPEMQGKGYGRNLIQACENQLISNGIFQIDVPTQLVNRAACKFYKKCGFSQKTITNIYHFWL